MNVLELARGRKPETIVDAPVDAAARMAQLSERVASLGSVLRSQTQDMARAQLHRTSDAGIEARVAKLETVVAELEAAVA
jgi:uncharacterized protein YceH (UPF0502 family)